MTTDAGQTAAPPQPHEPAFWQHSAERLRHVAELSRRSYEALHRDASGHDPSTTELSTRLAESYAYLIALALEYLAIGVLMARDPEHFLHEAPRHRILDLITACGIEPDSRQAQVLRRIQPALQWSGHAKLGIPSGTAASAGLKQLLHPPAALAPPEVQVLEALYDQLHALLAQEHG